MKTKAWELRLPAALMVVVEVVERLMETHRLTLLKLISRRPVDQDLPLQCKSISRACHNESFLCPVLLSARIPNYMRVSMERSTTLNRIATRVAVAEPAVS